MDKTKCFLYDPNIIDSVLSVALTYGVEEAKRIEAKLGAMVAAIVIVTGGKPDGELYLKSRAFCGDIVDACDPLKKWDDDPTIGVNYTGYAIGKVMQSIHTKLPSKTGSSFGYGESDDAGSDCIVCCCKDIDGNIVNFLLLTAYSGMSPEEDYQIARTASDTAWFELCGYKNPDGFKTNLCRIVDGRFL